MTMFHVAIGYKGAPLPVTKIQEQFGSSGWARYAPNCWLVHSYNETPTSIAEKLRQICSSEDTIFVVEVVPSNYNGYLHKETWEWFNKHK